MELEKAIEGIQNHRERIHKEEMWNNPMSLSDTMTKLSVYNAYLADYKAPLHKAATDKAYAVFTEAKGQGESTNYAEMLSRGESTEERELFEKVENIYKATGNLITVLQSRLKAIETQIRQEGQNET